MPQSMHPTVPPLSGPLQALIEDEWEQEVLRQLPANYEQQAHTLGAFVRTRVQGIQCVGDLLRGLLAYVLCAPSFRHMGAWALLVGLANLSHVAWQKRLRRARPFLLWLLSQQLSIPVHASLPSHTRVLLLDATRLKEPGGNGDDWRVHLGYDLLAGHLAEVKVHDQHTAEGFTLFDWHAGDVVVADRGYSRRGQLAYVLHADAQLVVRLAPQKVPLLDRRGASLDLLRWLKEPGPAQRSCAVAFEHENACFLGRLIACALPEEAAERARTKERKRANKQQRHLKEETLFLCGWLLLFSSLPSRQWSDEQVLELYRARWQVELVIKRMKQVLKLAQLRGKTALTNEATILALLLAWSLQQAEVHQARQVLTHAAEQWARSHDLAQGNEGLATNYRPTVSSWTTTSLGVQTLRLLVQGWWTFARLRDCLPCLQRYLCSRRRRDHQESRIRRHLLAHPALLVSDAALLVSCSSP